VNQVRFRGGPLARLVLVCFASFLLLGGIAVVPSRAAPARTLDSVRAGGALSCGVVVEQEDFTKTDSHGDLSAFSSAICRAVAAAVTGSRSGDGGKLQLLGFPDEAHGVAALHEKKIALLVGITPEASRSLLDHLRFSPTLFIDGQGFLVARHLHVRAPADLHDRLVCYLSETPAETALSEWSARAHVAIRPHPFEEAGEMEAALTTGNCDAITASVSALADMRAGFHGRKADFEILPQMITIDPFAAATRDEDPAWSTIVSDVVTALIEAEQDGLGRTNLVRMQNGPDPAAQRLLGPTPGLESLLGLQDGWAARAIAASGNYGEILADTTGPGTPLNLPRGMNALWNAGGLIYTPSIP
jgi:general L-amino acid transport system substrate-binding protein